MLNQYSQKYLMLKKECLQMAQEKKITQAEAGERLGVSRQTISKWLSRYRRFGAQSLLPPKRAKRRSPAKNKTSPAIEDMVCQYAEQYWNDGVVSLSDRICAEKGILLNGSTVYRILKRKGIRYDSNWNGTKRRQKKQLYCHKQAGQELQMDTKYPFGYKVGKVVYTVIDDASRWVFARVYETANAENTLDFLQKLIAIAPFDIMKIRTDCGTEFVNQKVAKFLLNSSIDYRKNTPYCPEENGKIERFHGTLNQQSIQYYWFPSDTLETLQYKLHSFLHYYNHQKRHRGIGMNALTPFQKLRLLAFNTLSISSQNVNLTLPCNNC